MLGDLFRRGLQQQPNFPVAGVVAKCQRRPIGVTYATLRAQDQVLIPQHAPRVEAHADTLRQPKDVATAPVAKDLIGKWQLASGAVRLGQEGAGIGWSSEIMLVRHDQQSSFPPAR